MKTNKFTSIILIFFFAFISCNKEIKINTPDCDFNVQNDNATNSKSEIYQEILDEYCAKGLPGLSLVIETPDDGLYVGTSGMAKIEDNTPMKPCHIHHSASIAKMYTATMILLLAQEGLLSLDDLAKKYLSEEIYSNISNCDIVTIRQLLNHSSGIYNFDDNVKMYVDTFNEYEENSSIEDLFENYVYGMPAYFAPGEDHHYSNTNFSLLGMIIENVSGKSIGEFMQENIIEPLALQNTYYKASDNYPNVPNLVNSYLVHFENELQNCTDIQTHFSNIAYGHEGVLANPYDFAFFIKNLVSGNILNPEYTAEMLTFDENSEGDMYGLGIFQYETDYETGFGHAGGALGTMTYAIYFPESQISFSICCNLGTVFYSDLSPTFYQDLYIELMKVIFTGER
ncbi:MAG: beta-lactamase family protein [Bacteroidales bacterium]|nr:beta-lactamase family protein [Bacteroidales bacterium]